MPDRRKLDDLAVFVRRPHVERSFWQRYHQAECVSIVVGVQVRHAVQ